MAGLQGSWSYVLVAMGLMPGLLNQVRQPGSALGGAVCWSGAGKVAGQPYQKLGTLLMLWWSLPRTAPHLQLPVGRDMLAASPRLLGLLAVQRGAWRLPLAAALGRALAALVAGAAACVVVDARARLGFLTGAQQQQPQQPQQPQQHRLAGACVQQGAGPLQGRGKAKAE